MWVGDAEQRQPPRRDSRCLSKPVRLSAGLSRAWTCAAVGPRCSTASWKVTCPFICSLRSKSRNRSETNSGNLTGDELRPTPPLARLSVPPLCSLVLLDRRRQPGTGHWRWVVGAIGRCSQRHQWPRPCIPDGDVWPWCVHRFRYQPAPTSTAEHLREWRAGTSSTTRH